MPFQKIALFAPPKSTSTQTTLKAVQALLNEQDITFTTVEKSTLPTDFGAHQDLIIVIGGDGSMLRAAQQAVQHQVPMIGINEGRLGFLTDLRANEIQTRLKAVLEGQHTITERFLLAATLPDTETTLALNDIVISSGRSPHMLELEIYINDKFVCSERADGLILSTPTGSTAYSLSGGGPILHPAMDSILMLPMFSHTLSARPIVVPGTSNIAIHLSPHQKTPGKIACDGNHIGTLAPGNVLTIQKYQTATLKLLHPQDYSYYESLRSKLQWGKKLTEAAC